LRARNLESGTTNYVLKHKAASSSFVANVCDRNCYTFLFWRQLRHLNLKSYL
jgi:hypothetical protein